MVGLGPPEELLIQKVSVFKVLVCITILFSKRGVPIYFPTNKVWKFIISLPYVVLLLIKFLLIG